MSGGAIHVFARIRHDDQLHRIGRRTRSHHFGTESIDLREGGFGGWVFADQRGLASAVNAVGLDDAEGGH